MAKTGLPPNRPKRVEKYLEQEMEKLLTSFEENLTSSQNADPNLLLPLVRIKVEYSGGYSVINTNKFM